MKLKKLFFTFCLLFFSSILVFSLSILNKGENSYSFVENNYNQKEENDYIDTNLSFYSISPSTPIYSWFGHSAIGVENEYESSLYDYGTFAFTSDFYLNFSLGRLYFQLLSNNLNFVEEHFNSKNRDFRKYDLNLNDKDKRDLVAFLHYNAKSENKVYLYHHYFDNCSTRDRDIFNQITKGDFKLWAKSKQTNNSYRDYINRYLKRNLLVLWTLNALQGKLIDQKLSLYEASFLPYELEKTFLEYNKEKNLDIMKGDFKPIKDLDENYNTLIPFSLFSLLLALLTLILGSLSRLKDNSFFRIFFRIIFSLIFFVLFLFLGIVGTTLAFMMIFSNHDVTYFNTNILFLNPLLLPIAFLFLANILGSEKVFNTIINFNRIFAFLSLLALVLPAFDLTLFYQENLDIIISLLPMFFTLAFAFKKKNIIKEEKKVKITKSYIDNFDLVN